MRRTLSIAIAAFLFASAAPVQAVAAPLPIDPATILPPPPGRESAAERTDLEQLHGIERTNDAAAQQTANALGKIKDISLFAEAIGPSFQPASLPATRALFEALRSEEKAAVDRAKAHFRRERPWIIDPALKTCSRNEDPQSSYPSGHATNAFAMAALLVRIVPSRAPEILARAAEYARSRVVCEVHFPTDIAAGQLFGTVIVERLMERRDFRAKYEAAARELRGVGLR